MATWNSDNIILTKLGEQVLSKVQSGVGKLTVSRIVSGAGHVSPSKLYNQSQITDIKQELTIVKYTTTVSQSAISANLTNTGLKEAYDLYQIGIYVTHPDFTGELLYLIAQCDSPDHIPLPGDNPVTLSYDLIMTHSGTKEVVINVSEAGHIDVTTFNEFADKTNTALNGKVSTSDFTKHINNTTAHVTPTEKKTWNGKANKGDIPTKLPADGGNADTVDGLHASDIQIDSISDTAESVELDGLQGGVPFSDITVIGKNLITEVLSAALGGNSTDGFRISDNQYCRSFVQKLLPNTTYTVKRYDGGNRFRIILFNEYPTNTADTTANQILNATTTPSELTFTTGTDHLWFALTTHNGSTDKTIVEPIVQLEYGDTATAYEEPIIGQEITLTACGKNLADLSGVDGKLISGISFAYDDGKVVLNGTSTATTTTYLGIKMHLSAGTYTVSGSMDKNVRVVLRNKSWVNIADSTAGATVTVTSDDYYVHIAITAGTVCDSIVIKPQLERGAVATEYEPYSGSVTTITPDSNPYTVPNDIRQHDGLNNVSVSVGDVSVIGVKKSPVINRAWEELDNKVELKDIPTTLPANGGNADTVDGKHASDFMPYIGAVTDLFTVNKTCICKYTSTTLNTPYKANLTTSTTGLCIVNYEAGINHVVYFVSPAGSTDFYTAVTANGEIVANKNWRKVSDNGNAATVNGLTVQSSVPANAVFTDTKVTAVGNHYTPSGGTTTSASGGTLTDITNSSAGVQVVTGVTKDAAGHVTGVTSVALKSTNTNTTYSNFVKSGSGAKAGLVPAPSTTAGTTKYLREDGSWQVPPNTTYPVATTSANGLMSSTDKSKLNGIATGATKVIVDSSLSTTSTNTVQNKVITTALNAKANSSDIPTSLPANGGNAATVNNQNVEMSIYTSTSSFGVSNTDTADTIWKALPGNSIFAIMEQSLTDPSWNFPGGTNVYSLLMIKVSNLRPLGMYLYPKSGGSVYFANVDKDGAYLGNWRKLCDGGDAATANTAGTLSATASNVCLRNMSSGTAEANDNNCPVGAWYGQYE